MSFIKIFIKIIFFSEKKIFIYSEKKSHIFWEIGQPMRAQLISYFLSCHVTTFFSFVLCSRTIPEHVGTNVSFERWGEKRTNYINRLHNQVKDYTQIRYMWMFSSCHLILVYMCLSYLLFLMRCFEHKRLAIF